MKASPLVISVAVHYNSPEDCIHMLSSLVKINYINHKVVVVDNCSHSSDYYKLKNYIADFLPATTYELIKNRSNVGYGGGINFAVEYASKYNPDYVHVINTDAVVINPDYVADLVDLLEHNEDIGIVGPAVLKEDRKELQNTILPFVSLISAINFKKNYSDLSFIESPPTIKDVECVNGVCFMMPAKVFRQIGGFDESYFMYGEEQDLCFSIYKSGFRRVFWSGSSIVHYGAEKEDGDKIDWRYVNVRKNQVRFLRKYDGLPKAVLLASLFSATLTFKYLKDRNAFKEKSLATIINAYFACSLSAKN